MPIRLVLLALTLQVLLAGQVPQIKNDTIVFNNSITVHLSDISIKTPGKVVKRSGKLFGDRWILREVHRQSEDDVGLFYFFSLNGKLLSTPMEFVGNPIYCIKVNRIFIPQASYMSFGPMPTLLLDGDGKLIASIARKGSPFMSGTTKDQRQFWIVWVKSSKGKTDSIFESYDVDGKCVFKTELSGNDELVEWKYGNTREHVLVKKHTEFETFY